jgi:anti-sigma regulatory factor (Ser/Thr protein kinase)
MAPRRVEPLTVTGELNSLAMIRHYVLSAAAQAGLDPRTQYAIALASDEIVTNIITHGYPSSGQTGDVEVTAVIEDDGLTIVIEDCGSAYDPSQALEDSRIDTDFDARPVGGLGTYLAVSSVDRFHYDRVDDRNRHTLFVRRRISKNKSTEK